MSIESVMPSSHLILCHSLLLPQTPPSIRAFSNESTLHMQIDGENVEIVTDFIYLGSKITLDADCSHEIKRLLLLGGR